MITDCFLGMKCLSRVSLAVFDVAGSVLRFFCRIVVIGFVLFFAWTGEAAEGRIHPPPAQRPVFVRDGVTVKGQAGHRQRLWLEIARTPDELAFGLMKLKELPGTDGMLFVMNQPQPLHFWMKDTLMPLDILFIDVEGTIIRIAAEAEPGSESYISSFRPTKAVLEIQGGLAERWDIKVGDKLLYKDFQ